MRAPMAQRASSSHGSWGRAYHRTCIAFVSLCALLAVARLSGLHVVYTPSVPMGLYWRRSLTDQDVRVPGQYVCLEGWRANAPDALRDAVARGIGQLDWTRDETLVKRVAAVGGDRVTYVEPQGYVAVNGVPLPDSALVAKAPNGERLPKAPYPVVLAADEVWLSSEHPRGFDSRYFGPVKRAALGCRTTRLWTW